MNIKLVASVITCAFCLSFNYAQAQNKVIVQAEVIASTSGDYGPGECREAFTMVYENGRVFFRPESFDCGSGRVKLDLDWESVPVNSEMKYKKPVFQNLEILSENAQMVRLPITI